MIKRKKAGIAPGLWFFVEGRDKLCRLTATFRSEDEFARAVLLRQPCWPSAVPCRCPAFAKHRAANVERALWRRSTQA